MQNLNTIEKDEKYNDFISSISATKKKLHIVNWYNRKTSEIYKRVDRKNNTLKKAFTLRNLHENRSPTCKENCKTDSNNFHNPETRTFFHTKDRISWLSRYKDIKPDYQYLPEEKLKRIELTRIFQNFDTDNNGAQDLDEFLSMFLQNYLCHEEFKPYKDSILQDIPVNSEQQTTKESTNFIQKKFIHLIRKKTHEKTQEKIQEFLKSKFSQMYKMVTKSDRLSLDEFIRLSLDSEASEKFTTYMRLLKSFQANNINNKRIAERTNSDFIPLSFDKMIGFLSYRALRNFIREKSQNEPNWVLKFDEMQKLFHFLYNLNDEDDQAIDQNLAKKEYKKIAGEKNRGHDTPKEFKIIKSRASICKDRKPDMGHSGVTSMHQLELPVGQIILNKSTVKRPSITDLLLNKNNENNVNPLPSLKPVSIKKQDLENINKDTLSPGIKVRNFTIANFDLGEGKSFDENPAPSIEIPSKLRSHRKTPSENVTKISFGRLKTYNHFENHNILTPKRADSQIFLEQKRKMEEKWSKSIENSKRLAKNNAYNVLDVMSQTNYSFTKTYRKKFGYIENMGKSASGSFRQSRVKTGDSFRMENVNDVYLMGKSKGGIGKVNGKLKEYFQKSVKRAEDCLDKGHSENINKLAGKFKILENDQSQQGQSLIKKIGKYKKRESGVIDGSGKIDRIRFDNGDCRVVGSQTSR